jgi:hypothetical protein
MNKTRVVPLRIPDYLDEIATLSARTEHTDKATALRKWLHEGAIQYILEQASEGHLSLTRGAELLGISVLELYDRAFDSGLQFGATSDQLELSSANAQRFVEELRAEKVTKGDNHEV